MSITEELLVAISSKTKIMNKILYLNLLQLIVIACVRGWTKHLIKEKFLVFLINKTFFISVFSVFIRNPDMNIHFSISVKTFHTF